MNDEPIDHEYTDEAVCPWCGYEHEESHYFLGESFSDGDEVEDFCGGCGKPIIVKQHILFKPFGNIEKHRTNITIRYSTRKRGKR
jgi:hypothetical protein